MALSPTETPRLTGVFSKCPRPGQVKTRLIPTLGEARAAELAEAMLHDVLERCTAAREFATWLWFAPAEEHAWFAERFPRTALRAQRGPELGERLAQGFAEGLATPGVRSLVVVGSDQPLLRTTSVAQAHARLAAGADLVLAPDQGGGYALVGLRALHPELFTEVAMSQPGMCAATLSLARQRGLAVELLEPQLDVDVAADLGRLREALASHAHPDGAAGADPEYPRHTARFLERHADRLP